MPSKLKRYKNKFFVTFLLVLTLYILNLINIFSDRNLHIEIFDVGQGDSILISTPSKNRILVDGGPNERVLEHLSDKFGILPCKLDIIVLTHPHADHVSGLGSVIERCKIGKVAANFINYDSEEYKSFESKVIEKGIELVPIMAENKIISDEIEIRVLWPKKEYIDSGKYMTNVNNTSVVLLIDHKNFEAILAGDIESEIQGEILLNEDIEVIKVPHQGALDGLNTEFLEKVKPELAVVSVGRNSYGHPDPKVLGEYTTRGINVLRTDEVGSVEIVTDGESWWINTGD